MGILFSLALAISFFFTEVTVTVKPRAEQVLFSHIAVTLQSVGSAAAAGGKFVVIPAERMEFTAEATEEFDATGKELVQEKARGKARIYNQHSSSPQPLVATTRFLTESGALFRLPKGITVPGAKIEEGKIVPQFIEAELVADKTGEEFNISGEVTMRIPGFKGSPKYEGFSAVAGNGFSGGFRGEARVISSSDLKAAEEIVTKKVYDDLKPEVLKKVPPEFKLVDALREVALTKISAPAAKTKADKFSVTAEGVSRVIVFREKDAFSAIAGNVLGKDGETRELMEETAAIKYQVKNADFAKGNATVSLEGTAMARTRIVPEEIIALVMGKKEGSMIEALKNRAELASFRITFFPFWLSSAPAREDKIRVVIEKP